MAIREHYEPERNVLFVTFEGEVGGDELLAWARTAAEKTPAGHKELIDLRSGTLGALEKEVLPQVAAIFRATDKTPEQSRVAIVADADVAYGLSRAYQAWREGSPIELRVFREMGEAREWLGLGPA